jgi:ribosomal protein L44E
MWRQRRPLTQVISGAKRIPRRRSFLTRSKALRFQPIRRPQVKQPSKPKPTFPKAPPTIPAAVATETAAAPAQPRSTLADWAATEEDEYLYAAAEKRQRGGRRRKKKKADQPRETDWDELYDPARPTNVEEYLHSEERIREVQDWKAVLYAHRRRRRRSESYGSEGRSEEEEEDRNRFGSKLLVPCLVCMMAMLTV